MNKKGAERVLSFFWLLVLVIVGLFVAIGVIMFYSSEQDVRELETEILSARVIDCLLENGQLSIELVDDEVALKNNLLEKCKLKENVFVENNLYLGVGFYDINNLNLRYQIDVGDNSYAVLCGVEAEKDLECTEKNAFVLNGQEKLRVHVLAASNNKGRTI